MSRSISQYTFANADDAVWWERRLIIVHIDNIDSERAGPGKLGRSFICSYDCQLVKVSNLPVQHNVGLDDSREGRLDHESVVVIPVHDMIDRIGIGPYIAVRC